MSEKFFISIKLFVLITILSCALVTQAKDKSDSRDAVTQKYQCKMISRGEAINRAKRKVKGKIVGVQLSEKGSRSVYKVRMLVEKKRVKTVSINACL
ncbi:MAG: hypothetical protein KUG78_12435 [Kangiellaceae bacterium]|nr:hypothetical protein [Kangiellaceae bacterium]